MLSPSKFCALSARNNQVQRPNILSWISALRTSVTDVTCAGKALRGILLFLCLVLLTLPLFGQVVSRKQEIAVFSLGYYKSNIPADVLGNIDEEIKGVFINIGRFDVLGMTQRLESEDINAFIDSIKAFKEENVEIPEEVQMGKEFFTAADLNRLIGSFIVVIPSVTSYSSEQLDNGEYRAAVKTTFTFLNVENAKAFAHATVETEAQDESLSKAIRAAINGIPLQLTYEIRKIAEFQLKTGILEVSGSEIIMELGRDLGIKKGDEFVIVTSRVLDSGKTLTQEKGLIIIKEISEEVSIGKIIYAQGGAQVGEQLNEVPRLGFESAPYVHVTLPSEQGDDSVVLIGLRQTVIRGFYDFRPIFGVEVPVIANILWGIPFNLYMGGEWNNYLGRVQITPMAAVGMAAAYLWYLQDDGDPVFIFTHLGGMAQLNISYLVNKDIKFVLEGGYLHWFSMDPTRVLFDEPLLFHDYNGFFAGGGISIKY